MRILFAIAVFFGTLGVLAQEVTISQPSGVYSNSLLVEITGDFEKAYYTLDGKEPSRSSKIYKKAIEIKKSTFLKIKPVFKDKQIDTIISRSYILNFETKFPILTLGIDKEDLWNDSTGIYAKGKNAWMDSTHHWHNTNYGKKWEREVQMIYLDSNKTEQVNQLCGIKIFGESTRRQPDKSMKIIARSEYGDNRFRHNFFPQKDIHEFKQLVIRTSGNDYRNTRFKDVLNAYLARNLDFDYMAYQPIQLFVNGEYWGVYNLREKINEHYLYDNHKANKDSSSIIMGRWVRQHGSSKDYMRMYHWFMNLDTMDNRAYEKAKTMLDIRNYINYRAYQIYIANRDSRGNVRYWNSKDQDGKFRMIMYDTDLGFGTASRAYLEACLSPTRTEWYNPEWSTVYFRKLMQHEDFKNDFVNQMAHFMNTCLHRDTIIAAADHFENIYKDELPRDGKLLAPHLRKVPIPMKYWLENVDDFRMFGKLRYKKLRKEIKRLLAPKGTYVLKLEGENGKVKINDNYAQKLTFEGLYYKNIPLPIEAVDNGDWKFVQWTDGDTSSIRIIETKLDTVTLEAKYQFVEPPLPEPEVVVENEISQEKVSSTTNDDWLLYLGFGLLGIGVLLLILLIFFKITKR